MDSQMLIPQLIIERAKKSPNRIALAYKHTKSYKTITFHQLVESILNFSATLPQLGVKPGDKIAIFSENRPEWVIADLAIQLVGAITVPIHSVFQLKYIKHVLKDSGAKILIVSDNHLFEKLRQTHTEFNLQKIIYFARNQIFGIKHDQFLYFSDLIKNRSDHKKASFTYADNISADSPATIVYTSGTTGLPKGVILTHRNMISNIRNIIKAVPIYHSDRFLSFLPLSHIFERTAGYYTPLSQGASIYYADDYRNLATDLMLAKPTILVGVPRVFEKAYEKIVTKKSFQTISKLPGGKILLSHAIKKKFGGHIRFCISGGAALDPIIGEFFEQYGLTILEGYGLTETSPVIACNRLENHKFGSCGLPLDNITVKLAPDHELLVAGDSIFHEYLHLAGKSKRGFTKDGYFHTGDLAEIDEDGFIHLIGRKKNILILSTGKNVQPEEIETALTASAYITEVMIVGEGKKMVTALITPEWDMFKNEDGWLDLDSETQELRAYDIIKKEIDALLADFPDYERVKKFTILTKPFSMEDDELSPTLKLKRKVIENHFKKEIAAMYK